MGGGSGWEGRLGGGVQVGQFGVVRGGGGRGAGGGGGRGSPYLAYQNRGDVPCRGGCHEGGRGLHTTCSSSGPRELTAGVFMFSKPNPPKFTPGENTNIFANRAARVCGPKQFRPGGQPRAILAPLGYFAGNTAA